MTKNQNFPILPEGVKVYTSPLLPVRRTALACSIETREIVTIELDDWVHMVSGIDPVSDSDHSPVMFVSQQMYETIKSEYSENIKE